MRGWQWLVADRAGHRLPDSSGVEFGRTVCTWNVNPTGRHSELLGTSQGVRYDAPRRKVIIVRITAQIVARLLMVLGAAIGALCLTWWLTQHFFHMARDVSQLITGLVAGSIVTVFGRWVLQEKKTDGPATADGKLNVLSTNQIFRRMVGDVNNLAGRIGAHHSGVALMMTVLVLGLAVAAVLVFTRRAQPAVTSPGPPAGPPVATSLASPLAPAEPTPRDGAVSEIASSETGLCAEVRNLEQVEGAIIDQGTCQGGANQKFKVLAGVDPGTFKIQALHSGKCMTVTNDKRIVQVTCADSTQFWRFRWRDTKRSWHYWEIRNTAYGGGFCLDLPGYNHDVGTPLQARECNYANNQQWRTRA